MRRPVSDIGVADHNPHEQTERNALIAACKKRGLFVNMAGPDDYRISRSGKIVATGCFDELIYFVAGQKITNTSV
jgi:hypothetical protein